MPATIGQRADLDWNINFAKNLFAEFNQKNTDEGITLGQGIWIHHRFRAWSCIVGGNAFTVDIVNMLAGGNIAAAYYALLGGTADLMILPYEWLNSTRIAWLTNNMKAHLGLP